MPNHIELARSFQWALAQRDVLLAPGLRINPTPPA